MNRERLHEYLRFILFTIFLILAYILASKIGFFLAFLNSQVSPIWPPEGVALAAILLKKRRAVLGIFLGAFLANYLNNPHLPTALLIGIGNSFGAVLNSYLILRFMSSWHIFDGIWNLVKFFTFGTILGSAFSAILGVTSLLYYGFVPREVYWNVLVTWFSGELQGYIIVGPFLLVWFGYSIPKISLTQTIEFFIGIILLFIACQFAFGDTLPVSYLPLPFLVYFVFRNGRHGALLGILLLSIFAVYKTISGVGPFVVFKDEKLSLNNSLILLDTYIGSVTFLTYALLAVLREREVAKQKEVESWLTIQEMKDDANRDLERKVQERTLIIADQKLELEKQIEIAGKIQESLLPNSIPEFEELRTVARVQQMMNLGGDFYDIKADVKRGTIGFFLCDVSGHGVPAALLAAMTKMSLSYWYEHLNDLKESFEYVHKTIHEKLGKNFISACMMFIDVKRGKLKFSRAGHFPAAVINKEGELTLLNPRGRVLLYNIKPLSEEIRYTLKKGDRIFLYTDGLLEARNPEDGTMFTEERLLKLIQTKSHLPIQILLDLVFREVHEHCHGQEKMEDDATLIITEYIGKD
ncbi:MAG: SpoIIE family protein phosphatase [Leptospiraceae bacterium]|nr:SpoIIE family protein phosphatase [Leptospiraceae bacterium]